MLLDSPSSVLLPSEPEIETPAEASSFASVIDTSPSDVHPAQKPDSDV